MCDKFNYDKYFFVNVLDLFVLFNISPIAVNVHAFIVIFILNLVAAVDYGGPRKEFFALYLQKAYEQLVTNEHTLSLQDPMLLGNGYYALGVIMGKQ